MVGKSLLIQTLSHHVAAIFRLAKPTQLGVFVTTKIADLQDTKKGEASDDSAEDGTPQGSP